MSRTNPNIEVTLLSKEEVQKKFKILQRVGAGCREKCWTSTPLGFLDWGIAGEFSVSGSGALDYSNVNNVHGIRPVLKSDNLDELIKNCKIEIKDGIQIVEYGEYPHLFEETEKYNYSYFRETGKTYSLPPQKLYPATFVLEEYPEYDYNGQNIIIADKKYHPVKPVKFYVDRENSMLISTNVLYRSPINIDNMKYNSDFKTSQLYNFLNNEFIKDLLSNEKTKYSYYDSNLIECIENLMRINEELQAKSEAISRELEELKTTAKGRQYVKKIK